MSTVDSRAEFWERTMCLSREGRKSLNRERAQVAVSTNGPCVFLTRGQAELSFRGPESHPGEGKEKTCRWQEMETTLDSSERGKPREPGCGSSGG